MKNAKLMRGWLPTKTPSCRMPLNSQAVHLPPLTARSRNLVRFQRHLAPEQLHESFAADYGFRAEGSRFSVLKQHGTAPGPDDCFAHIQIDARPVFRKLLGLEVDYPGAPPGSLTLYTSRNHYRSHIEELFHHCAAQGRPSPPVRGRCVMFYSATDVLQIVYELRNHAAAPVALRLRWFAEPQAGKAGKTKAHPRGFRYIAIQAVNNGEYRVSAELTGAVFARDGDRLITAWHAVTVPAHGVCAFPFTVRFNDAHGRPGTLATAVRHVEQHLAALPALPREWGRFEPVVLRAAGIVLTNRYTERTGARTVHSGKTGTEGVWFWDTPTNVLGLGLLGGAATGWHSLRLLCEGIPADGRPPGLYCDGVYNRQNVQNPVLAWGVWNFHQLCPDRRALRACYPALVRYVTWWRTQRDGNGNGLYEWPPDCCTGLDDALTWHSGFPLALRLGEDWATKDCGHSQPSRFEAVDWNTQLHLELRALACIARVLGRAREATVWAQATRDLGRRIHRELFNPAAGVYQARCIDNGRFNELVSLESFLPLYAGLTPRPLARQLCRDFLLNPDRFYPVLPFPTLDLRHEAFRGGGELYEPPAHPGSLNQRAYWIGRTWLNYSYWMVGALAQSGLRREADTAAEKILDAVSRHETIYECYDPLTGAGNGHPEFTWGAAAVLALASAWAVMKDAEGYILNWYGEGEFAAESREHGRLVLRQQTDYPLGGAVRVSVEEAPAHSVTLKLRIPNWSGTTAVRVSGEAIQDAMPGTYLSLRRRWKAGHRIEIELDLSLHAWVGERQCRGKASLYRGPILLTWDRRYNGTDPDGIPSLDGEAIELKPARWTHWLPPALLLEARAAGGQAVKLCDFASAGNGGTPYRTWLPLANPGCLRRSPFAPPPAVIAGFTLDQVQTVLGRFREQEKNRPEEALKTLSALQAMAADVREALAAARKPGPKLDAKARRKIRDTLARFGEGDRAKGDWDQALAAMRRRVYARHPDMLQALRVFSATEVGSAVADVRRLPAPARGSVFKPVEDVTDENFADIRRFHRGHHGVVYIRTAFDAAKAAKGELLYGADGPVRVWVNGRAVGCVPGATNPAVAGAHRAAAAWKKGVNEIVFGLLTNQGRAWGVFASVRAGKEAKRG